MSSNKILFYLFQSRLLMELNFMLAYGAAEPSILLLQEFKLLEILLPFHVSRRNEISFAFLSSKNVFRLSFFLGFCFVVSGSVSCKSNKKSTYPKFYHAYGKMLAIAI